MLRKYQERDVSAATNPRLTFPRPVPPAGGLVHTSSGVNSLAYLQGGVLADKRIACADCLISRDGTRYLLTPAGRAAYHAGIVSYTGLMNDPRYRRALVDDAVSAALLGVEIECLDTQVPTLEQVDSIAEYFVLRGLQYGWRWPFYITGHYATARPLGRRSDPVNFDWGGFAGRLWARALEMKIPGTV